MKIDIIGVPIDLGADRRGVDMGPSAIRYAHLHTKLEELGYTLDDKGNIEVPIPETCSITDPRLKYIDCILPMVRRVAGAVATSVQAGRFPLVLGRSGARQNIRSWASFGSMRMPISTRTKPLPPETFMGCLSPLYVGWVIRAWSVYGMTMRLRFWTRNGSPSLVREILTPAKNATCMKPA